MIRYQRDTTKSIPHAWKCNAPDNCPDKVRDDETAMIEMRHAYDEGNKGSQYGHESRQDDRPAAVIIEEALCSLDTISIFPLHPGFNPANVSAVLPDLIPGLVSDEGSHRYYETDDPQWHS